MHVCRADPATLAVLEQEARHAFRSRRLSQVDRLVCERYSEDYWLASSAGPRHLRRALVT
jgi:hypothetical protein